MVIRFRFFILLGDVVPKVLKYHHLIINTALAFSETPPQTAIPKHNNMLVSWEIDHKSFQNQQKSKGI